SLLAARHSWSLGELAGRLEVSERTVRRDIDTLRGLGYPVVSLRGPAGTPTRPAARFGRAR
ncbi:helix-turn-helix domain-containing protein, partial [Nocardia carnea]|uniref:helix-turn-helix domain-containing protein n=1 Tax=Nocardia carnea TaxID=37328 RepID=UPI003D771D92